VPRLNRHPKNGAIFGQNGEVLGSGRRHCTWPDVCPVASSKDAYSVTPSLVSSAIWNLIARDEVCEQSGLAENDSK
jgi:hypothetical protein